MVEIEKHNDLVGLMQLRAEKFPNKKVFSFIKYEENTEIVSHLTYREIDTKARQVAVDLKKRGIRDSDRVIIFSISLNC